MANLYNLKRFDLNLLIIFECIYQNLSISQAAQTLFITPSAVSQSLQRLRNQLDDPLFVRSGKGITPTTAAINLHRHLEKNLNNIEETINIMGTSDLRKRFVMYGPQFHAMPQLTEFMNHLLQTPHLEIIYHDTAAVKEEIEDILNYRKADVVFSLEQCNNRSLVSVPFCESPVIFTCRKDHPRLADKVTNEDLLKERFAVFQAREEQIKHVQSIYENSYYKDRDVAYRSSSLMSILNIIHHSDLVGVIPEPLFRTFKDTLGLKVLSTDIPLPKFMFYMIYSRSSLSSKSFSEIIKNVRPLAR